MPDTSPSPYPNEVAIPENKITIEINKDVKDRLMEFIEISKPVDNDGKELNIVEINKIRSSKDSIMKVGAEVSFHDLLKNINDLFKINISFEELNDYISA